MITKPRNINTSNFTSLQQSSLSGFSLDTHQQTLRLHPPGSESELGHHPMVFAVEEQLLGRVVGRLRVRVIEVPVWSRWAGKKGPSCSSREPFILHVFTDANAASSIPEYDDSNYYKAKELEAFEETKAGVKGLVDSG
ncbi:hypothetical protein OIU84_028519, partial [Salix udensis]